MACCNCFMARWATGWAKPARGAGATSACAFFSAITALAPNLTALVVSRAAMGASAAGIIPLCMAWIGDQVPYEQRQETLAGLMVATVSGMMAGQWFGGFAVEALGWRVAFACAGLPVRHGRHAAVAAGECVHARCWQRASILCAFSLPPTLPTPASCWPCRACAGAHRGHH